MKSLKSLTGGIVLVDVYAVGSEPVVVSDDLFNSENVQGSISRGELAVVDEEAPKVAAPKAVAKAKEATPKAEE